MTLLRFERARKGSVRTNGKEQLRKLLDPSKPKFGGAVLAGKVRHSESMPVELAGRLLSIDPGLAEIGYAIFKSLDSIQEYGMVRTSPKKSLTYRLKYLHYALRQILKKHNCAHIIMEDFYGSPGMKNRGAVIDVAKAHGALQVLPKGVILVSANTVLPKQKERNRKKRKLNAIRLVKQYYGIKLKFAEHHVADAILQGRWFYANQI